MERNYKFRIGQEVKINYPDGNVIYGEVIDYTSNSVFIQWYDADFLNGFKNSTEHFQNEYHNIQLK